MDLVGNHQAQAALQERFEQLLNQVQQLSVIAEHQQQEIAELKAQLGHQSSLAQSFFQSHSGDVSRPSPPLSVKPKKPEIFSEKAEDVDTWIVLWQNLYHITKTPPEEQAPMYCSDLSLADPPGEAGRGGQGRRNPHHIVGRTEEGMIVPQLPRPQRPGNPPI
uniref:Uncharacterized protein n=1 Tax=Chromera velia CCMP2878 TaxID=1169474 RepID=A0A0G4FFX9_9ALVE|eukprot:Cvel_16780.t1-p1 / transcript=Cvel_16780.t1 / gene=Cvel_16780 / organism=Chromera_velia_CCMP2878 / gene_product=hypothetical protein / transcript_product=hypothetical protein / location=Cvel_scaffold1309:10031-10516(-) / protein_length=162 / sequence_SO=supercontig / SO=protein_coding / is_pseudo=false